MSEKQEPPSIPSNEDIISDLTKDLHLNSKTEDHEDIVINEFQSCEDLSNSSNSNAQENINIPDTDPDKTENKHESSDSEEDDDDVIDEEALKDAELDLTDDQKLERQIIAEELKVAGNNAFKDGDFERSIEKYTEGLRTCPLQFSQLRAILYCNRSAAKMKLEKFQHAAKDCTKAIELDEKYTKAYIRRAQSYEKLDKLDECLADYKKVLELNPDNVEARAAQIRLPPIIEEKNEKLKTEMLGKLKDLGNMILRPFGLSTENFQLEQDPDTKGYKINFKNN